MTTFKACEAAFGTLIEPVARLHVRRMTALGRDGTQQSLALPGVTPSPYARAVAASLGRPSTMPTTLRVYLVRALLDALLCTQAIAQLGGGEAGYSPGIDQHRFGLESDRILSPRDTRLVQPSGRGLTFEFHLTRRWGGSTSADIVYCVAYVGGQRRIDRGEQAPTEASPVDRPIDPYAEPQAIRAAIAEATEGP